MLELFHPYVPKEAISAVRRTLKTRWIGQGPKVDQFEKEFCKAFNLTHAIAVSSGTAALETAYDIVDLKAGDEVISTPLTCTATNLPLIRRGVKIIWADILKDTLCIDPVSVHSKITDKTKAVIQVHLGGIEADVGKVHVPVISDACKALGIFKGNYTACSFQAIKHITTGDGGMFVCDNFIEARKAKLLRWFGIDRERKIEAGWDAYKERKMTFDIELAGTKRQMNDIAAAMGIAGLKYYYFIMEYRRRLFHAYKHRLSTLSGIQLVDGRINTYWLATVLVERRDAFARMLFEKDIDTNVVQVRNDIYKIFGGKRVDLPVLNDIEEKYLSLPIGMHVTEEHVHRICDLIEKGW